jgi:hypothetical protein
LRRRCRSRDAVSNERTAQPQRDRKNPSISQLARSHCTPTSSACRSAGRESFAEAPDGSLWVATGTGLARFDGRNWTRVAAANFPRPRGAISILIDSDGTLWLVSLDGSYSMPAGGHILTKIDTFTEVTGLAESPGGVLWLEDKTTLVSRRFALRRSSPSASTCWPRSSCSVQCGRCAGTGTSPSARASLRNPPNQPQAVRPVNTDTTPGLHTAAAD